MSAAPTQPIMGPWTITYSNAGINQINTTFYYEDQMVHWLADYGLPLVNVTLATIDSSNWWNTACTINYAAQAGGCGVMFFVVLALSQASKRRTPIFILNVLSLLFGFFRGLFLALYFVSPWVKLYPSFTNDYSAIPTNAYVISIFGTLFPFLMSITVSLSLVLQVYTVIKNMKDAYRYGIIAMSGLVFFLAVGFAFARMVINNIDVMHANWYTEQWVMQGALYTETISIWYFSIIFTSKLVYTLHFRRKHGWKQWSGVKILAAMGGCTMVIPCSYPSPSSRTPLTHPSNLRHPPIPRAANRRHISGSRNHQLNHDRSAAPSLLPLGQHGHRQRVRQSRHIPFHGLQQEFGKQQWQQQQRYQQLLQSMPT